MEQFKTTAPIYQELGVSYMPAPFEEKLEDGNKIIGWAPIGVGEDEPHWRLMKEVTEGGVTKRLYAQGSMDFEFKWSERANYIYSR